MEIFEKKEILQIRKYMSVLASALCGIKVAVIEITSGDGIGYSQKTGRNATVAINFQTDLVPTKKEREIFVYGVFAHELMHILRTDFEYDKKMMSFYPARERYYRHQMMNIIEDPAIEFFAGDHLSDFLNKCLQYSIAVIYQRSPRLEESMTPYTQLLNALIQFGDLGFTIGEFSFPEAEEAFRKVIKDVNEAIEEPLFKKRFNISMDVFNKTRDLLEKDLEDQKEFEKFLQDLLKKFGKGAPPEGDGEPISADRSHGSGDPEDDGTKDNGLSARRKKTVVLLTEEHDESSESGNGSDDEEKTSETDAASAGKTEGSPEQPDKVAEDDPSAPAESDEADNKKEPSKTEKASAGKDSLSEEDSAGDSKDTDSKDLSDAEKGAGSDSTRGKDESPETSNDVSGKSDAGDDSMESNGSDSSSADSGKASEGDGNDNTSSSGNGSSEYMSDDMINELLKKMGTITEEMFQTAEECREEAESSLRSEAKREQREKDVEDIDIEPYSPYIKGEVNSHNVIVTEGDDAMYESIVTEMSRYISGLTASLKRLFEKDRDEKAYRKSGKLNIKRAYGNKITARLFTKTSRPGNKQDMAVIILLDESGSMSSGGKIVVARNSAIIISEVMAKFHIPVKVVGFTSDDYSYDNTNYHYGEWKNSRADRIRLTNIGASGGTFLGYAMRYAGELLKKRPEEHKIYIVVTDGDPYSHFYQKEGDGLADIKDAVFNIQKFASVIGIGLFESKKEEELYRNMFKDSFLFLEKIDNLPGLLNKRFKEIVRKW